MIKIYATEVIGVDPDDHDRVLFTARVFDAGSATLKMDTLVSPQGIGLLCKAIQQAIERLELEAP